MSFATALEAASALATEYSELTSTISAMACAADHDPTWGPGAEAKLNDHDARRAEVARLLAVAFSELARDHRDAWQGFLVTSTKRLDALARHGEDGRIQGEYERDQFTRWTHGTLPAADQPEIFARGLRTLDEHSALIDRLMT